MSDTVEKIYCTNNNDALLASVMGKKWIMGKQC